MKVHRLLVGVAMTAVLVTASAAVAQNAPAGGPPAPNSPPGQSATSGANRDPATSTPNETRSTAAPEADTGDIVVTANRTESLLSRTPVSLTAVTGDGLRSAGVTNATELKDLVPNLSIDRNNGGVQITIRGVTSTDTTEKGDPSAAFLLDGVYIARPQAQETSFYDIARVEVLRGPQGTLYGRNTTAGLVNVITNRPTFDFGASGDFEYSNYDTIRGTATLNVPVNDTIALRAAVNYDRRDNYLDAGSRLTGGLDPFKRNIAGRVQGLVRWGSGDLLLRGDYADIQGTPFDLLPLRNFYAATAAGVSPVYQGGSGDRFRRVNAPIPWNTNRNNDTWGVEAELNQQLGPVTATYLGSYREFHRDELDARISADAANAYRLVNRGDFKQVSQELRFATNGSGPLKLQAGGYYFREESTIELRLLLAANPGMSGDGATSAFFNDPTIAESYAAFGQGTWSLTEAFRVTGGVRYSHDNKSRDGFSQACTTFSCTAGTRVPNDAEATFSKVTWRGGVDWDLTPTTLVYGTVSSGYKAGGFNDGCIVGTAVGCVRTQQTLYYSPETLTSYEAGLKTRLLDNALRLNLAAFHYDYSNIQLTQVVNECGGPGTAPCSVTANGGRAKVSGVEAEGVVTPGPNDRFDFSATYLDAHYSDYRPNATTDFSGRRLDRSPPWTFSAGYAHTFPLGNGGDVAAGVRTRVSDGYTFLVLGTLNFYRQPSFSRTDATITYNAPGKAWYLQGFAKNLEDANVVTTVVVGTRSSAQISDPRTYGVRAGFRF